MKKEKNQEGISDIDKKMQVLRTFANARGLPTYSDEEIANAKESLGDMTELDVLIAYLQNLGVANNPMVKQNQF